MQRDSRAYLNELLDAAAAIQAVTTAVTVETYGSNRLIRSSVEREFFIIGEALKAISQQAPDLFNSIRIPADPWPKQKPPPQNGSAGPPHPSISHRASRPPATPAQLRSRSKLASRPPRAAASASR